MFAVATIAQQKYASVRDIQMLSINTVYRNEIQEITVAGAVGGTFAVTYSSFQGTVRSSKPIPFDADHRTFFARLGTGLRSIGSNDFDELRITRVTVSARYCKHSIACVLCAPECASTVVAYDNGIVGSSVSVSTTEL